MNNEEHKARKITSYPPLYLKEKALKYTKDTGTTMSDFISDLVRGFFSDPKNKPAQ